MDSEESSDNTNEIHNANPTPEPNVVANEVANHYNTIEEKGLEERAKSRIFHMRNFNNWIKSILIKDYLGKIKQTQKLGSPLRVLDLCCGKGGDLMKWKNSGITHLICTDIAEISVEQCRLRYEGLRGRVGKIFTAEFLACDSTLTRLREKYEDASMQLNLVSCQFAFHYCFESMKQAECMIRNASECLVPGGFFIATIPNSYEIMRRQQEVGSKSFGNEVYHIDFVCDPGHPPLFGAKYNFHLEGVVDCPEFLVHFPTLVKLCKKFGLELDMKANFADYYNQSVEKGKKLLEHMHALETYPGLDKKKHPKNSDEYSHVAEHYQKLRYNRSSDVGTLSKSEWEATTIYMVFAFRKLKTSWDKDGKPIYD